MKLRLTLITSLILAIFNISALANDMSWHNMLIDNTANPVYSIHKDRTGLMWIGTNHGLYTYDGHAFRKVTAISDLSIVNAHYYAIVENTENILFGTSHGLMIYDRSLGSIERANDQLPNEIRCILKTGNTIWVGSLSGLFTYDTSTGATTKIEQVKSATYSLIESKDGYIYIGTYNGLYKIDQQTHKCVEIPLPSLEGKGNVFVNSLLEDKVHECVWIGTEGMLLMYDPRTSSISMQLELNGNSIKSIHLAPNTDLLIGTDNGFNVLKANGSHYICRHDSKNETSIGNNEIWVIYADDNCIWAGTEYGISVCEGSNDIISYRLEDITGKSIGNKITSMLKDRNGGLWIGGPNGLIHWNNYPDITESATWFSPDNPTNHMSHNHVRNIRQTKSGDIWIATDGGINMYDRELNRLININLVDKSGTYNANWAYSIVDDANGKIWVGAYLGGIMSFTPERKILFDGMCIADTSITQEDGLANNLVGQLDIDSEGNKWVLLFRDRCIYRINHSAANITKYDILSLTGAYPQRILCDIDGKKTWCGFDGGIIGIDIKSGNSNTIRFEDKNTINEILSMAQIGQQIWISSRSGLWAFNTSTSSIEKIPFVNAPITSIYYDEESRRILLGTIDKLYSINPSIFNAIEPPTLLNIMSIAINDSIQSNGLSLPTGYKAYLENSLCKLNIELSSYNYQPNRSIRYAYRIDKKGEWIRLSDGEYQVSITGLERGEHTIEFTIGDSEEQMTSLVAVVSGPWYTSPWAYAFYLLLALTLIVLAIFAIRRKAKRKADEEERRRTVVAVQNRINFLSNISHDLKTPLSLIVGPVSKLLEECTDPTLRKKLSQVYDNAIKLNTMVHKAIEINRLDQDKDALMIFSRTNVVEFCKNVFDSYMESHPDRHFIFSSSAQVINTDIDAVKMESVLNNLLSNACKYSEKDSTISCSVSYDDGNLVIMVSDDGVGIPKEEQSLIFQRLFRSNRTATLHEGTGIGLYLVKQYVEMHGGSINLISKEDEGSTFTISIPAKVYDSIDASDMEEDKGQSRLPKVLIVEDNTSISDFIKEVLMNDYQCVTATNGRAALSVASTFHPDIIITDEMMPVMTGLEMCRRIKETPYLAGIPIIMLTAKDDNATETESVKLGINTFMPKPFNSSLLKERVKQLIEQRRTNMQEARREVLSEPKEAEVESQPEKQLAIITEAIEKNISDPKLNVSYLSQITSINQQQIYRLTKKFVGQSPIEYIRQIRLRQAAMLLKQRKFTISEVMYMVGFSSSSYFSKCFQVAYGVKPSQYADENN